MSQVRPIRCLSAGTLQTLGCVWEAPRAASPRQDRVSLPFTGDPRVKPSRTPNLLLRLTGGNSPKPEQEAASLTLRRAYAWADAERLLGRLARVRSD